MCRQRRSIHRRLHAFTARHSNDVNNKQLLYATSKRKKGKGAIVLREIHLRTTGRHLSMGSHSVICHPTDNPNRAGWYSMYRPRKDERPPSWPVGWLRTEMVYPSTDSQPSRDLPGLAYRCSATTLIEANALPLSQTAKPNKYVVCTKEGEFVQQIAKR